MPSHGFKAGDRVIASGNKFSGKGVVLKALPVNVQVKLDDGQTVRFAPCWLRKDDGSPVTPASTTTLTSTYAPPPAWGAFVRVAGPWENDPKFKGQIWVVVGTANDKARLVPPGGSKSGRYWRIPFQHLREVRVTVEVAE